MALIRAGSALTQPLDEPVASGGVSGTTMGPATPTGAAWMWAPVAGRVRLVTVIAKQICPWPSLRARLAVPDPSGSPGPGTSLAPARVVANGRPPSAARAGPAPARPASAR